MRYLILMLLLFTTTSARADNKIFYDSGTLGKWKVFGLAYPDHSSTNNCTAITSWKDGSSIQITRNLDKKAEVYIRIQNSDWKITDTMLTTYPIGVLAKNVNDDVFFSKTGTGLLITPQVVALPHLDVDMLKIVLESASMILFKMPGTISNIVVELNKDEGPIILDHFGKCVAKAYQSDDRRKSL